MGEKILRPQDGPGNEVGEERDKKRILREGVDRLHLPAVDIKYVAQGVERVKGDPYREDDVVHLERDREVHRREGLVEPEDGKIVVLEIAEGPECPGNSDDKINSPVKEVIGIKNPRRHNRMSEGIRRAAA